MPKRIGFTYGEFYDVPRMLELQFRGQWYFLSSRFNDSQDDYNDFYDVYALPYTSRGDFEQCYWTDVTRFPRLGTIPVADMGFDATFRESIDAEAFEGWLSKHKGGD